MHSHMEDQFKDLNRMILSISGTCNFRCKYCYAHFGDFNQNKHSMSFGTGKIGIDLLFSHVKQNGGKKISLVFMGGEPLLQWRLLCKLVSYAKNKARKSNIALGLSISTNGSLLDKEKADYLKQNKFIVLVSIDGKKHDKFRPDANGKGTYKTIIKNVKYIKKGIKNQLVLRSTFSKQNSDLFDFYTNFEIKPNRYIELMMIPIISSNPKYRLDAKSIQIYKRELKKYANYLIDQWRHGSNRPIPTNLAALIERNEKNPKLIERPCVGKSIVLAPNGVFYSCPILIYDDKYKIGDVVSGLDWNALESLKNKMDPLKNAVCKKCKYLSQCGGGCYATNKIETGNPYKVDSKYCEILKYEFKIARLLLKAASELTF